MKTTIQNLKRAVTALVLATIASVSLTGCVVREDHDHYDHDHDHFDHHDDHHDDYEHH